MNIDKSIDKFAVNKRNANKSFINAAINIGIKICEQAFWSGSRCNWIGKTVKAIERGSYTVENQALGPSLYDGTSGIALFLSYLFLHTKREEYYTTAKGAINQALSRVEDIPSSSRFGFYAGDIGIAYAATKIGKIFNEDSLLEKAIKVLKRVELKNQDDGHVIDVISGNAGAIPPLLHMYYNVFHDKKILELALQLGDELVSTAIKQSIGWSWTSNIETEHNLTGFSHGAAGIAYGLLELFNKTDKEKFRYAAEQAISYENHWFSLERKNWPDFRTPFEKNDTNTNGKNVVYSIAWCHGAPGIGFSRLRAYQILKKKSYLRDLQMCIQTSIRTIKEGDFDDMVNSRSNYSLCHGLSGICELLLCSNELSKDDFYRSLAVDVGIRGIEHYTNNNLLWPCGIPEGEPPGLMLGISGIGYFYLRLCKPSSTPCILLMKAD
jgi:lantibiotic biosynthesis protein